MDKAKKRHYIYLAGNISDDVRTYEWREKFTELVGDDYRLVIVDPCKNKFNQSMKGADEKGLEFAKEAKKRSQKILRAKDYQLVRMCSVIVVNLELHDPNRPMVGTVMELAWSRDVFYVPVIAITGGVENTYTMHPWIDECCSAKVETVEEAADTVKTFFLDY